MILDKPKVIFLVGPTAVGKSSLAILAAKKYGSEIINCDSVQFYQSLNIGSAKPTVPERQGIPHHLLDFVEEGENYTAGGFRRDALDILEKGTVRGVKSFLVVGGSGFYMQALVKGMFTVPEVPIEIKEAVRKEATQKIYAELMNADPAYALKLSPNDSYRIARAVEVLRATGKTFSEIRSTFKPDLFPYEHCYLGLRCEKSFLLNRVSERAKLMLENGLIEETEGLLNKGLINWKPLSSVGYKEAVMYLKGEIKKEDLLPEIIKSTMLLAKKQMTWFKRTPNVKWFDIATDNETALNYLGDFICTV